MPKTTLSLTRDALLDRLAALVRPLGYQRRQQSFRKDAGESRLSLHVAFVNHAHDFDVTADVAVRHHAVETLLHSQQSNLSPRDQLETATIGAELGNLAGTGQHRWNVTPAADLQAIAEQITSYFHQFGEPFLTRFSHPAETLRVLAADDREARLICPIPDRRQRVLQALREIVGGSNSVIAPDSLDQG